MDKHGLIAWGILLSTIVIAAVISWSLLWLQRRQEAKQGIFRIELDQGRQPYLPVEGLDQLWPAGSEPRDRLERRRTTSTSE